MDASSSLSTAVAHVNRGRLVCLVVAIALGTVAAAAAAAAARAHGALAATALSLVALSCGAGAGLAGYLSLTAWRFLRVAAAPCYEIVAFDGARGVWAAVEPPPEFAAQPRESPAGATVTVGAPIVVSVSRSGAWELLMTEAEAAREAVRVRAVYRDRLGNRLFQYCVARLRAAFLDVAFEAPPLPAPFSSVATRVERWSRGRAAGGPVRHAQLLRPRECCGTSRAGAGCCPQCGGARGLVSPAWLRVAAQWLGMPSAQMDARLLAGSEAVVAAWLRPPLEDATARCSRDGDGSRAMSGSHDVAVHVRAGDIVAGIHGAYSPLPMSFYARALRHVAAESWAAVPQGRELLLLRGRAAAAAATASPIAPRRQRATGGRSRRSSRVGRPRSGSSGSAERAVERSRSPGRTRGLAPATPSPTLVRGQLGRVVIVTEDAGSSLVQRTAAFMRRMRLRSGGDGDGTAVAGNRGRMHPPSSDGRSLTDDARPAGDTRGRPTRALPLIGGDVVVAAGSVADDLGALYSAPNLVLSVSSFAWWPALLSTVAARVVVPRWGLMLPQLWRPDPARPGLVLRHDLTLRPVPPDSCGEPADAALAQLQSALTVALAAGVGGAPDAASFPPAPRVLEVALPRLQRWRGNIPSAVEALFDASECDEGA